MLKIKTWRDPYDAGFSTTRPKEIEIKEGLTVLVGCNGAGKSTLINNIKEVCKKEKIPVIHYDNLTNGGEDAVGEAFHRQNYSLVFTLKSSSEGECVKANFGNTVSYVRSFLKTGLYNRRKNPFADIFAGKSGEDKPSNDGRRVLLFDAIDSGLSVDSVVEVRDVFDLIMEDAKKMGVEVYIVASANEYELARCAPCFDVATGRYVEIEDYEDYRSFILDSRKRKDNREKAAERKRSKTESMKKSMSDEREGNGSFIEKNPAGDAFEQKEKKNNAGKVRTNEEKESLREKKLGAFEKTNGGTRVCIDTKFLEDFASKEDFPEEEMLW